LKNDQFHSLYSSPDTIGAVSTRRTKSVEHVTHMGNKMEDFGLEGSLY
jgi:hypothetical protein